MDAQVARDDQEKKDAENIAKAIKESLDMHGAGATEDKVGGKPRYLGRKVGLPKVQLGKERQHMLQPQQKDSKDGCRDVVCGEAWHSSARWHI